MFYTLADLRTTVRYKADQFQTQRVKNAELDGYINDGKDAAVSLIFPLRENYFTKTRYRNLVANQTAYYVPEDAKSMIGVDISSDNGSNYYPMTERDIDQRNNTTSILRSISNNNSYYYDGSNIELLTSPAASTNGLRFKIIWEHWDLDDDADYTIAITACTRASGVVTATMADNSLITVGDVIALTGMSEDSFDGAFKIVSKVSTTQVTFNQVGKADASAANTGSLRRRYGLDLPSGRTTKRFVEHVALDLILKRDNMDTSGNDKQLNILSKRIKMNLNNRTRGVTKRIRKKSLYNGLLTSAYGRSN